MKQITTVENILKEKGAIDNFYCIDTRLTTRLGAYIHILKKRGWTFRKEMHDKNCHYYVVSRPVVKEQVKEKVVQTVQSSLFSIYPKKIYDGVWKQ